MKSTLAAKVIEGFHSQGWQVLGYGGTWAGAMRPLEVYIQRKVERAVKAEREACAKICDARYMGDNNREDMEARRCAAAIRARGIKQDQPEPEDNNPSFG